MDPVTMQFAAQAAGAAFKGINTPTGPTISGGGGFVGSADGYTVSTGGGSAQGGTVAKAGDPLSAVASGFGLSPMYLLAGAVLLAVVLKKRA